MDFAAQLKILEGAKGQPALVALLTVDLVHGSLADQERARIKEALIAAAVPHWFDARFMAALLESTPEDGERLLAPLRALTVVEPFPARGEQAADVHEATRLALREHLRTSDAERWRALSRRAYTYTSRGTELHARIEALYHLFAVDQPAAAAACEALDRDLAESGRAESHAALALALKELAAGGWLSGTAEVEVRYTQLRGRALRGEATRIEDDARAAVALAMRHDYPSGIGRARVLLGDGLRATGRAVEALAEYRASVDTFQQLTARDPSNRDWEFELAVALSRVADVAQEQGRLRDAEEDFQKVISILERLTDANPDNAGLQRNLTVSYMRLGDFARDQGRTDQAYALYVQGLDSCLRLVATDASNPGWQTDLATAYQRVGHIALEKGNLDEAAAVYAKGLEISKHLADADPSSLPRQENLADSITLVGDLAVARGMRDEAQAAFRENLAVYETLLAADPLNAVWRRSYATAHLRFGNAARNSGEVDTALASYLEALSAYERLSEADPSNASGIRDRAVAQNAVGRAQRQSGQEAEAQVSFRKAAELMKRAVAMSPETLVWKKDLENLQSWVTPGGDSTTATSTRSR